MKIAYDFQVFTMQKYGGISRYFADLINYFNQNNEEVLLPFKYSNNEYLKELKEYKNMITFGKDKSLDEFLPGKRFRGKGRLYRFYKKFFDIDSTDLNRKASIEALKKGDFDVYHPTYYEPYFLDYIGNKPYVLTVYDLTHEIYPEYFDIPAITPKRKKILIEKASKVIAISENTKQDIVKHYGTDSEKIEVVYLSSNLNFEKTEEINNVPDKFILFVGNRNIYKNFYFFIRVAAGILNEDKSLKVVCCGGGNFNIDEELLFESLGISDRIHYFNASNSNLVNLYKKALVFVFPSLYEGFGIPLLEAFSCNCPVVCSNTSSLPEIALDGAKYFDPKDYQSMKETIKNVVYNESLRQELISKGAERLKDFSIEKTAKKTLEVYKSVVK